MKFDCPVIRAKITPAMIGADCLLVTDEQHYKRMQYGEEYNACIAEIADRLKRSYAQLGLYWACCKIVAENNEDEDWNTPDKVDEQCKIKARLYDYYIFYQNEKTGEKTLNIKTGSIAFDNLAHLDACAYFTDAFQVMADKLGVTVDELIDNAKNNMRGVA